ncbi:hypothetical protein [Rossellomorea marisflavi]|uniref:hypothetical protein n=1 Tax=Rossellomorea marisflavi TaxID=189381 RepID=UPI0011E71A8E|nr:hypothetical protein [Rossellomorea marisflavi]TYO68680.1 hypothetical protein DQ398_003857 [Rossellomorea marisflavi]
MKIKEWIDLQLSIFTLQNKVKSTVFSPILYSLSIKKECLVEELNDCIKDVMPYVDTNNSIKHVIRESLKTKLEMKKKVAVPDLNFSCYIYFITVKEKFNKKHTKKIRKFIENRNSPKESENRYIKCKEEGSHTIIEKLVYIGETADLKKRFIDGHKVTQALNSTVYNNSEKRVYLARVSILMDNGLFPFYPLEVISPKEVVKNILRLIESTLIPHYGIPEYNTRDKIPKLFLDEKTKYDSAIVQADFINISYCLGNSLFFENEETVPLPHYLTLGIDKLPMKVLRESIHQEAIRESLKKVGITEHLSKRQ